MKDFSEYKLVEDNILFSCIKEELENKGKGNLPLSFLINDFHFFARKDQKIEDLWGNYEPISQRLVNSLKERSHSKNEGINIVREVAIYILLSENSELMDSSVEEAKEYVLWRDGLSDEDRKKHKLENMTEEDKKRMSYHMVGKEPSSKQISFLRSLGVVEVPKDMAHASRLIDERLKKGVARSNTTFLESQSWGER